MKLATVSGIVTINKKTKYGKWLVAYIKTGAWTGSNTISEVWKIASSCKPKGVIWSAWGMICGNLIQREGFGEVIRYGH